MSIHYDGQHNSLTLTTRSTTYQMLIAYLDGGGLDALVTETGRLQVIGASGRLMDLENEQMRDVLSSMRTG